MDNLSLVESIFFAALDRASPEDRAAYLEQACGSDEELRRCVERLLSAHPRAGNFLQPPALAATVDEPRLTERPGTVIGPYTLLEQIGEGGMGLVFVAEQRAPIRRKVALKVIKPGMDSRDVLARFEAERQALALMDHPNIARVLDAGTTESGRPYFVMELVCGVPITEYGDQNQLTPRQQLELFLSVCQAVQHAHQKGIIHRDLKPSNILVAPHDGTPVVKVIDFGIAKAVRQRLTEKTIYTRFAQMIGTPLYMSPEQAEINQLDVDTRSDIYSLGVLLYELLTGTTPFDPQRLQKAAFDEVRRIIREEEPPRPSTRLSTAGTATSAHRRMEPGKLSAMVRGDLDWIVMKALEKDRARRYETASAFAADIRRFLSEEPVEARPPSAWYRLQKSARRNRVALTTAGLVALALVVGTAVSLWQARRAFRAEADARMQREAAEHSRQQAEGQRDDIAAARAQLQEKTDALRRALYLSNMKLAADEWQQGQTRKVLETLQRHQPAPGECDLRGFEWHYLWRLGHGARLTLPHRAMWVGFSPDGRRIASVDNGGTAKVWDAGTGNLVCTAGQPSGIYPQEVGGAWSPDGKLLALTAIGKQGAGEVRVFDPSTGKEVTVFRGHKNPQGVAFSPDGKRIASVGSGDRKVRLWEPTSGKEVLTLDGHSQGQDCVAYSPDGKRIAIGESTGGNVKAWDAASGKEAFTAEGTAGTTSLAYSPDGKLLVAANYHGGLVVMDAATGTKRFPTISAHAGWIYSVAFSPDSKTIATGSGFGEVGVRLWDAATGREVRTIRGHEGNVHGLAFSPDGKLLAVASDTVKVWDVTDDQQARTLKPGSGAIWQTAFSPDGTLLATTGWGPAPRLWDSRTWTEGPAMKGAKGEVPDAGDDGEVIDTVFDADGRRLAGAVRLSAGGPEEDAVEVRVWDVPTGRRLAALRGLTHWVGSLAFSPDGLRVAAVGRKDQEEAIVKVWELESGREVMSRAVPARGAYLSVFAPDGKRIATSLWTFNKQRNEARYDVKLWDLSTGEEVGTFAGLANDILRIVFSRDGRLLAAADYDGAVCVWEAGTGKSVATWHAYAGSGDSVCLAFSTDSSRLATASGIPNQPQQPGTIHLWDLVTGRETLTLAGHRVKISSLTFSPDGNTLVSADHDGTVKVWDATPFLDKQPGAPEAR